MHQCSLSPFSGTTIGTYLDADTSAISRKPEEV